MGVKVDGKPVRLPRMSTTTETRSVTSVTSQLYNLFVADSAHTQSATPTTPTTPTTPMATHGAEEGVRIPDIATITVEKPALARARRSSTPMPVPEPIGCSQNSNTKTVITLQVELATQLDRMLALAKPAIEIALANKNDVHLVMLGASGATVKRLVNFKTKGVFDIEPEKVYLVPGNLSALNVMSGESVVEYLSLCTPVVALGESEGPELQGALWVMMPGQSGVPEKRREWRDTTNARWKEEIKRVKTMLSFANQLG